MLFFHHTHSSNESGGEFAVRSLLAHDMGHSWDAIKPVFEVIECIKPEAKQVQTVLRKCIQIPAGLHDHNTAGIMSFNSIIMADDLLTTPRKP